MRLICPNCAAAYEVPGTMLGAAPRRVRCARCGHEWMFAPTGAESQPATEAEHPAPAELRTDVDMIERAVTRAAPPDHGSLAMPLPPVTAPRIDANEKLSARGREPAARRARRVAASPLIVGIAWLLTFAVLGAAIEAAVVLHADVVKVWPAAERAYRVFGLV